MSNADQLLLKQVNGRTWWRGDMNRQSAIDHLTDLPVGSFVVRPSSQPGAVALSFKQEDGHIGHNTIVVEHEKNRIPPTTFRFSNASVQFETVKKLLKSLPLLNFDRATQKAGAEKVQSPRDNAADDGGVAPPPRRESKFVSARVVAQKQHAEYEEALDM